MTPAEALQVFVTEDSALEGWPDDTCLRIPGGAYLHITVGDLRNVRAMLEALGKAVAENETPQPQLGDPQNDTSYTGRLAKARERERQLETALREARPLVYQWCHYQGNTKELFDKYLGPIDALLAGSKP